MLLTCFKMYFQPIYIYTKKMIELATDNNSTVFYTSFTLVGLLETLRGMCKVDVFGVPNILVLIVISNVLIDAYYGIKKSVLESRHAMKQAAQFPPGSPDYKKYIKISELKRFQWGRLQFTFFKCFTLLAYLYFAKTLLRFDADNVLGAVLGYTSSLILKLPVALFWYYDFKSIGDNSAYVYGKKARIFIIVETLFELRIKNQINKLIDKK